MKSLIEAIAILVMVLLGIAFAPLAVLFILFYPPLITKIHNRRKKRDQTF